MTDSALKSPAEAERPISELLGVDGQCKLFVREGRAFGKDAHLPLGVVSVESNGREPSDIETMIANGAFEWRLPSEQFAREKLSECLGGGKDSGFRRNVDRALDDIASIAVRAGLLNPVLDAAALEEMPYRGSTTVVADTSGVLHGALDFVARNLHPATRVKVPAIVHMEIIELTERFFSIREKNRDRKKDKLISRHRSKELTQHMNSQGGQRAILRIELQSDVQIERTWLLGDPIRHAFQRKQDDDIPDLNVSVPVRSYMDRLILEDARRHRAQSDSNHRVRLLTGDQGLARMALAEGVTPIYFSKTRAADFFGARLTGQTFDPFGGEVRRTPLASVLWELAVAFGSVCLKNGRDDVFRIVALGEGTSWSPYHSSDDLLWCEYAPAGGTKENAEKPADGLPGRGGPSGRGDERRSLELRASASSPGGGISFGRFSVDRMVHLVCALDDHGTMTNDQVLNILGARSSSGGGEYGRFLTSANLISIVRGTWRAETGLGPLSAALRNGRTDDVRDALKRAPSFSAFAARIRELDIGRPLDPAGSGPGYGTRSAATYRTLGEITLLCASAFGEGPFPTPAVPDTEAFAEIALKRFSELDDGGGLVTVGAWLETMIRGDGIHPEVTRRKLETANAEGLLRMSTEGSTPELRYDNRVVHVLRASAGEPVVERVRLYRGDYLIPGKASVSLRIEGAGR